MPQYTIDFSQITDDLIPEGQITVLVEQVELRESRDKQSHYLNWTLQVLDEAYIGRKLFMTSSLKEKALWRLKNTFRTMGIEQEQLVLNVDDSTKLVTEPQLDGYILTVSVSIDEFDEKGKGDPKDIRKTNRVDGVDALVQAPTGAAGTEGQLKLI